MVSSKLYKSLRQEAKLYYKSIGVLQCPAFPNEIIYFQGVGFKHLIYKDKKFRPIPDQIRRFKALYYVKEILTEAVNFSEYRQDIRKTTAHFWSFDKNVNGVSVSVLIRKIDNGPLHFFSIRK